MWRRRLLYALLLLAAFLGQVLDVGYLFHYLFALTLALPLLSLAVSLPGMLGCRGRLTGPGRAVRGQRAAWSLTLENRVPLPVAIVKGRVRSVSRVSGEAYRRRILLRGACAGSRETWAVDTARCDLVEYRLDRLWVCDCLGLFALPVRRDKGGAVLVCPVPEPPSNPDLPDSAGRALPIPRGKSAFGEDYELRAYRPGDSLRLVHWKQSAKRDEPVTREVLEDRRPLVVLTFDHFGAPEAFERTMGRLAGWARVLLDQDRPFEVRWAHPDTGALRRQLVENEGDYLRCLTAALSDPAPAAGRPTPRVPASDRDGPVYPIHLTGEEAPHGENA